MSRRLPRVNQLIKEELSQIVQREVEFPGDFLVTLTRVETSPDLKASNIWISIMPRRDSKRIFEILNKNIYILQQKLGKRLKIRPVPIIKFLEEKKTEEAGRIEEILEELKKKEK